jgi:hypothetical protein
MFARNLLVVSVDFYKGFIALIILLQKGCIMKIWPQCLMEIIRPINVIGLQTLQDQIAKEILLYHLVLRLLNLQQETVGPTYVFLKRQL